MTAISKKAAAHKPGDNSLAGIASQIRTLEKNNVVNVIAIGGLLEQAAALVEHGEYMVWLLANFGWSHGTSLNYRKVYQLTQNRKICDFDQLNISLSALYLAAQCIDKPATCDAIFEAARAGRVSYSTAKAIVEANKPKPALLPLAPALGALLVPQPTVSVPATPAGAPVDVNVPEFLKRDANNSSAAVSKAPSSRDLVKATIANKVVEEVAAKSFPFTADTPAPDVAGIIISTFGATKALNIARLIQEKTRTQKPLLGEPKPAVDGHGGKDAIKAAADRAEAAAKSKLH